MYFDIFQRVLFSHIFISLSFVSRVVMCYNMQRVVAVVHHFLSRNEMTRMKAYGMPSNTLYVISGAKDFCQGELPRVCGTIAAKSSFALTPFAFTPCPSVCHSGSHTMRLFEIEILGFWCAWVAHTHTLQQSSSAAAAVGKLQEEESRWRHNILCTHTHTLHSCSLRCYE